MAHGSCDQKKSTGLWCALMHCPFSVYKCKRVYSCWETLLVPDSHYTKEYISKSFAYDVLCMVVIWCRLVILISIPYTNIFWLRLGHGELIISILFNWMQLFPHAITATATECRHGWAIAHPYLHSVAVEYLISKQTTGRRAWQQLWEKETARPDLQWRNLCRMCILCTLIRPQGCLK